MHKLNTPISKLLKEDSSDLARGYWSLLQFMPNPSTREVFNLGIVFKEDNKPLMFRLLKTATNFEIMYGKQGKENFGFLLAVLKEYLDVHSAKNKDIQDILLPSTQINITKPQLAQGRSTEFIIDNLFKRLVPLAWNETRQQPSRVHSLNSQELKKKLFSSIKKQIDNKNGTDGTKFFHEKPFKIQVKSRPVEVDFFLYKIQESIISPLQMASVISIKQKDFFHRNYDYLKSLSDMRSAKEALSLSKLKQHIMILDMDDSFDQEEINKAHNEIDNLIWQADKEKINVTVHRERAKIEQSLLQYAA